MNVACSVLAVLVSQIKLRAIHLLLWMNVALCNKLEFMKKIHSNCLIAAAPKVMAIMRNTKAIKIPKRRASCLLFSSILSLLKMITNTNKLSKESEYSVNQPAKNSCWVCESVQVPRWTPKAIASDIYSRLQRVASFRDVFWFRRITAQVKSKATTIAKIEAVRIQALVVITCRA